jgi:cytochrome P450
MIHYEPFSEEARHNPYPLYRALRKQPDLYWAESAQAWVLSRYDDVMHVLKHPELFSSDAMGGILSGRSSAVPANPDGDRVIILMDPPRHSGFRNLLNRGFTPRRIAALEPRIREITAQMMAKVRSAREIDFVSEVALPVPMRVIAELLGVEPSRSADFRRWSEEIIAWSTGSQRTTWNSEDGPDLAKAMGELQDYFAEVIEERRAVPREDLISTLIEAQEGEAALSLSEVVIFALVLLIAGNETTINLIGSMIRLLSDHPDQMKLVLRDRNLIPGLIEETLRFSNPLQFLFRRCREPVEIAGQTLPRDSIVIALLASANRDEKYFENPEQFDITRDPHGHISFGFGVHFCMGAALARLEARVVMEALLDELPNFEASGDDYENMDSYMLRGPKRLIYKRIAESPE